MPELPAYVLDSFALLAHFQDEGGQGRVLQLLQAAASGQCRVFMSLINLGEAAYLLERRRGLAAAQAALGVVQALPVQVLPADETAVFAAAHLKARFPISFADAFAAQAAQAQHATLVTGDPEFQALAGQVQIEWMTR